MQPVVDKAINIRTDSPSCFGLKLIIPPWSPESDPAFFADVAAGIVIAPEPSLPRETKRADFTLRSVSDTSSKPGRALKPAFDQGHSLPDHVQSDSKSLFDCRFNGRASTKAHA
jgi:hypothetical protein